MLSPELCPSPVMVLHLAYAYCLALIAANLLALFLPVLFFGRDKPSTLLEFMKSWEYMHHGRGHNDRQGL